MRDSNLILSRNKLRELKVDERTIFRIVRKAIKFKVSYDKMTRDKRNWIVLGSHFKQSEWVEKQKQFIKTVRFDYVKSNVELLELVEGLRNR
jgi:hypothetical protein